MSDKLIIMEDITDWRDETFRDENVIESEEDIYKALDHGVSTSKLSRAVIVSRQIGKAPEDIISPNKELLNAGAQMDVIAITHKKKVDVSIENGKTYQVNAYVGKGNVIEGGNGEVDETEAADPGPSYVSVHSGMALDRSLLYLNRYVTGNIWNRLLTIHECKGDVKAAADSLIMQIEGMVQKITEPNSP